MSETIKIRRGSTSEWNASTRKLASGEFGLDETLKRIKMGDGVNYWQDLPYISLTLSEIGEASQDYVAQALTAVLESSDNIQVTYNDSLNRITLTTGPNVVTSTSLNNTLTDSVNGYVPIADVGAQDGIAPLDSNALIPDMYISSLITRDSELTSAISTEVTDRNSAITSAINTEVINRNSAISTAISNLVNSAPSTLDTLKELSDALNADPNFATTITTSIGTKVSLTGPNVITSGSASTIPLSIKRVAGQTANLMEWQDENGTSFAKVDKDGKVQALQFIRTGGSSTDFLKADGSVDNQTYLTTDTASTIYAPLASPTFTGTISGITKTMVGLGNVDNTSDANKPVSTATQTALNAKSDNLNTYITESTTARSIAASDLYKIIETTNSGAVAITIPSDPSDTLFPIGSYIEIRQMGTGQVTVSATSPATVVATDSQFKTRVRYSSVFIEKRASNSWYLTGDTSA